MVIYKPTYSQFANHSSYIIFSIAFHMLYRNDSTPIHLVMLNQNIILKIYSTLSKAHEFRLEKICWWAVSSIHHLL